jgi:hypothetical protein
MNAANTTLIVLALAGCATDPRAPCDQQYQNAAVAAQQRDIDRIRYEEIRQVMEGKRLPDGRMRRGGHD